jgi:hypothetical protein
MSRSRSISALRSFTFGLDQALVQLALLLRDRSLLPV